jgi:hypothetical protein
MRAVVRTIELERGLAELELHEAAQGRPGASAAAPLWVDARLPLELGYARHVYKVQGLTVDTADLAVSLRTHLNELYVMVSRAREGAWVHALAAELEEIVEDEAEENAELDLDREVEARQLELAGVEAWEAERRPRERPLGGEHRHHLRRGPWSRPLVRVHLAPRRGAGVADPGGVAGGQRGRHERPLHRRPGHRGRRAGGARPPVGAVPRPQGRLRRGGPRRRHLVRHPTFRSSGAGTWAPGRSLAGPSTAG